jgi:hypothetical protein
MRFSPHDPSQNLANRIASMAANTTRQTGARNPSHQNPIADENVTGWVDKSDYSKS